tara:strand:+ start:5032 stop:5457 length:426 start_codon:yes stop_codon:yes gene_type:complete
MAAGSTVRIVTIEDNESKLQAGEILRCSRVFATRAFGGKARSLGTLADQFEFGPGGGRFEHSSGLVNYTTQLALHAISPTRKKLKVELYSVLNPLPDEIQYDFNVLVEEGDGVSGSNKFKFYYSVHVYVTTSGHKDGQVAP